LFQLFKTCSEEKILAGAKYSELFPCRHVLLETVQISQFWDPISIVELLGGLSFYLPDSQGSKCVCGVAGRLLNKAAPANVV